ncbi:MAG: hypothetical protein IJI14_12120 [Anaerolineaceae bacterium]|nr:hypothetical protein [Anaerolineaceae bacterium]
MITRRDWIDKLMQQKDADEVVFRIARGCDRCGMYLPDENGNYECRDAYTESCCRIEHSNWLSEKMDF